MVSSRRQPPTCPVCSRSDAVKTMSAAYEAGNHRFAAPVMPVAHVPMMRYIVAAIVPVGIAIFLILVLSGMDDFGIAQVIQVLITLALIVTALVVSFLAFQRVVAGDRHTQRFLPAWDRAMENWRRLSYCTRDNVVFDPQTNKTLSDAEVRSQLAMDELPQAPAQSAMVSH